MNQEQPQKTAEVQELTWAMLDDLITDAQFERLNDLLASDDQARQLYVECVQLHADLAQRFAGSKVTGLPLPFQFPLAANGGFAADLT